MSKTNITIVLTGVLIAFAAIVYRIRAEGPKEAAHSRKANASEDLPAENDTAKSNEVSEAARRKKERFEHRKQRQETVARVMALASKHSVEPDDDEKIRALIKETTIPTNEIRGRLIRNKAIESYIWTEGAAVYDTMISEQMPDPAWTAKVSAAFEKAMQTPSAEGSRVISVNCFETMCRGIFTHANNDAMLRFRDASEGAAIDGPSQGFIRENADGTIETAVYFARNGDDALLIDEMHDRLYEKITGKSVETLGL